MERIDSIIQKNKEIVHRIKTYLDIVNYDFLVNHMEIKFNYYCSRRDCDDNDVFIPYIAYDLFAQQILNLEKENGLIRVPYTDFYDSYLAELDHKIGKPSTEAKDKIKNNVCDLYCRYDHICDLIGQRCIPSMWNNELSAVDRKRVEDSLIQDLKILDFHINSLSEFEYQINGYSIICEINQYNLVRLKKAKSVFGNRVTYYDNDKRISEENSLDIPFSVKWMGTDWNVIDISDGFFDNCNELETVILPDDLETFSWSFWNCPKLKEIKTKNRTPDVYSLPKIISRNGILYKIRYNTIGGVVVANDCELLAFPNMYAKDFYLPEKIEVDFKKIKVSAISKFAFKCCDNLESLHIPYSVKHIGINAFYRCNNLRFIYYYGNIDDMKIDGFAGDYGSVNPKWLSETAVSSMQPKVDYAYSVDKDNIGVLEFKIGGVKYRMIRVNFSNDRFFFLGETAVTRSLWKIIMKDYPRGQMDEECPIRVNYLQALSFLSELKKITSFEFRLPTAGVWYDAAKGGEKRIKYSNGIHRNKYYHVKSIRTNNWGFYDMLGPGELCENDLFPWRKDEASIMGCEYSKSVKVDSGETAFRLYLDYKESKRIMQKLK